jgi:membrane associated rhomboid family serine protease
MLEPVEEKLTFADLGRDLRRYGKVLFGFVAVLWVLEVVSWALPIDAFGVRPRETAGLIGVLTHPFLHVGLGHLLGNSVALLLFGGMVVLKRELDLYVTAALSVLVGGLGIWLVGRGGSNHIGASGLVFGLFGYLLSTGFFERRVGPVLLSVFVFLGWGSMLFGMAPTQVVVSWEGHLFGFVGGVFSAWLLARRRRAQSSRSMRRSSAS